MPRAVLVPLLLVLAVTPAVAAPVVGSSPTAPAAATPGIAPAPIRPGAETPAADCGFPVARTDATGARVTLAERPGRIVTLNPSAAQTLWELGARDRVVGVSEFAGYLNGTDDLPVVDTASGGVNVERIVALDPDLVLAPGTIPEETVRALRKTGVPVFALNTSTSVDGVATKTRLLGRLTGECTAAARTNDWMRRNVAAVREAVADEPRPRALYVFGSGYTVGSDTFVGDVMRTAGLRNVAAEAGISGYARISPEVVRERNPQWLVLNGRDDVPDGPAYRETTAVRENRTVVVDVNDLNQPAPGSIVRAVRTIARAVHPAATADVTPVPRPTATGGPASPAATHTTATTPTTPTASPTAAGTTTTDGPGFDPLLVPVAAALLALAALARRRA
ncbi:MAG: PGF-CTERM-anchored ABC transporter substrate-binding protein [Haloferacaceae archaeon]